MSNDDIFSTFHRALYEEIKFHEDEDKKMMIFPSSHAYAWHFVNEIIADGWKFVQEPAWNPICNADDKEELINMLIGLHNSAVDGVYANMSPVRHWAIIDDVRLRMGGLLGAEQTLTSYVGLKPLPPRPASHEPVVVTSHAIHFRPDPE